jgi:hypothetical protein
VTGQLSETVAAADAAEFVALSKRATAKNDPAFMTPPSLDAALHPSTPGSHALQLYV